MRLLAPAVTVITVAGCVHAHAAQQPRSAQTSPCVATGGPMFLLDGIPQLPGCALQNSPSVRKCEPTPLYVVEGIPIADTSSACKK